MNDVVVSFPSRAAAGRSACRTAEAVAEGLIDIRAAAIMWKGLHGRARVAHGLPLTRSQRAEHALVGIAPLVGVAVDLVPAALGVLPTRVPAPLLQRVHAVLPRGRTALALRLGAAAGVAPVLSLAELVRGRRPVAVVLTTLELVDEDLLVAALA